jgi:hypothetical protein
MVQAATPVANSGLGVAKWAQAVQQSYHCGVEQRARAFMGGLVTYDGNGSVWRMSSINEIGARRGRQAGPGAAAPPAPGGSSLHLLLPCAAAVADPSPTCPVPRCRRSSSLLLRRAGPRPGGERGAGWGPRGRRAPPQVA